MNDFHILSLCIQNKDVAGAMRVLRDKSEFAARKILEKLKVRVTSQTGRAFWHHVQSWLLMACRQENTPNESVRSRPSSPPSDTRPAQSGRPGYGQASGAPGHADRPHQYGVYDPSSAGDVCAWPDGIPPVHAYLGDERAARTRTSSGESKPSVDMGHHHPARLQPGLCRPSAVVGTEHSLRVRRRHAAARPAVPVRQKGKSCRCSAAGHHDLAAESGQLRSGGCCAGHRHGNHHRRTKTWCAAHGNYRVRPGAVLPERIIASAESAGRHAVVRHSSHTRFSPDGPVPEHSSVSGRLPALHATTFLLHCLYRPSSGAAPPDAPLVREPQFRGVSAPREPLAPAPVNQWPAEDKGSGPAPISRFRQSHFAAQQQYFHWWNRVRPQQVKTQ